MIQRCCRPSRPVGLLLVAVSLWTVRPEVGQSQEPLRDNRTARRVEVQTVTTLRFQNATVAPDIATKAFHLPDGGWGALSRIFGGVVPLFSPSGNPNGILGRPGPGPGEFKSPISAVTVGKQLWIVDPGNNRITAFGSDGDVISDRTLPGRVVGVQPTVDSRGLLLSGFFVGPSGVVHTIALVTMNGAIDHLGGRVPKSENGWVQLHMAAETLSGEIWAVAFAGGEVDILSAKSLELLRTTRLPESLSQPEAHAPLHLSKERPAPQVYGMMVDPEGILWIVMAVADAHWRPGLNPRTDTDKIFDTLVLAVSTGDRAIVGARRMDQSCQAMAAGLIACPNEDLATVDVRRLSLER